MLVRQGEQVTLASEVTPPSLKNGCFPNFPFVFSCTGILFTYSTVLAPASCVAGNVGAGTSVAVCGGTNQGDLSGCLANGGISSVSAEITLHPGERE